MRFLQSGFYVIRLMADANDMDNDSICSAMKSKMNVEMDICMNPEIWKKARRHNDWTMHQMTSIRSIALKGEFLFAGIVKKGETCAECRKTLREEKSKLDSLNKWNSARGQMGMERRLSRLIQITL